MSDNINDANDVYDNEKEYSFNFRGQSMGVMALDKEGAYGYFYSTYPDVSRAELDKAYNSSNNEKPVLSQTDKPVEGKQYLLTGAPGEKCIANGNTWKESEIKK